MISNFLIARNIFALNFIIFFLYKLQAYSCLSIKGKACSLIFNRTLTYLVQINSIIQSFVMCILNHFNTHICCCLIWFHFWSICSLITFKYIFMHIFCYFINLCIFFFIFISPWLVHRLLFNAITACDTFLH